MKTTWTGAVALALIAGSASAGGLDRSGQSVAAVFDADGVSASLGFVTPSIGGTDLAGGGSYDSVGDQYGQYGLSYTNSVGQAFNYALIMDQPYGADITYGSDPLTTALGGTSADLNSTGVTFVGRYRLGGGLSVFGGIGVERISAEVTLNGAAYTAAIGAPSALQGAAASLSARAGTTISPQQLQAGLTGATAALDPVFGAVGISVGAPAPAAVATGRAAVSQGVADATAAFAPAGGYQFEMEPSTRPTYLIGAAYEVPDIALRISGTYRFETSHSADTTERFGATAAPNGTVDFVSPQSFNLEAQSGIAPGTLLLASWRWTEFSAVDLVPTNLQSDLVNLDDTNRFSVGIGRQVTEAFAASVAVTYEPEGDDLVSPLGPTNGLLGLTLGARYTDGPLRVTGGLNYSRLGDARPEVANTAVAQFSGNSAVGIGIEAEFSF